MRSFPRKNVMISVLHMRNVMLDLQIFQASRTAAMIAGGRATCAYADQTTVSANSCSLLYFLGQDLSGHDFKSKIKYQ